MKCNNCGHDLPDDAVFCEACGTRVTETNDIPTPPRQTGKRTLLIFALMFVAAAGIGLALRHVSSSSSTQDTNKPESNSSTNTSPEVAQSDHTSDKPDSDTVPSSNTDSGTDRDTSYSSSEDTDTPFILDKNASADYTKILDPSDYAFYSSDDIEEFSFWYPTDFFNDVLYDTNPTAISYGTNEQQIIFSADDGAQLTFQAVRRTDSMTLTEMSTYVYTTEMGTLTSGETILNASKDDYSKIIVTGWTDDSFTYTVYCMTKVKADYILQMRLIFPASTSEDDRMQKWYLTECFYRMCGFSDADPWRSYTEYVKENS